MFLKCNKITEKKKRESQLFCHPQSFLNTLETIPLQLKQIKKISVGDNNKEKQDEKQNLTPVRM